MGLITAVVSRGTDETVVAECRHCGTTVEQGATGCPTCDSSDIVTYRIQ